MIKYCHFQLLIFLLYIPFLGLAQSKHDFFNNYITLAAKLYDEGLYKEAIEMYNKQLVEFPNDVYSYEKRGNAKEKLGLLKEAQKDYDAAVSLPYNTAIEYYMRANIYKDRGDYEKALLDIDKAIQLDKEKYYYFDFRAGIKTSLKKYSQDEILQDYTKAIEVGHNLWIPYYNRAFFYYNANRLKEALADMEKEISMPSAPYFNKSFYDRLKDLVENKKEKPTSSIIQDSNHTHISLRDFKLNLRKYHRDSISPSYYLSIALELGNQKDYLNAILYLDTALNLEPHHYYAYIKRASYKWLSHKFGEFDILKDYDKGLVDTTESEWGYQERASYYYSIKKYQDAIDDIEKSIQLKPTDLKKRLLKSYQYTLETHLEKPVLAMDTMTQGNLSFHEDNKRGSAIITNINKTTQLMNEAAHSYSIGDFKNAILKIDSVIANRTNNYFAYGQRALYKWKSGMYSDREVLADYGKALEQPQKNPAGYRQRASYYAGKQQYELAIGDMRQEALLKMDKTDYPLRILLQYEKDAKYPNAILVATYDSFATGNPKEMGYKEKRAQSLKDIGLYKESLSAYNDIISIDPSWEHYRKRAGVKTDLKKYDDALLDYDKAISLKPNEASNYFMRGLLWMDAHKYESAIGDLMSSLSLDPNLFNAYIKVGIAFLRTKRYKEAIECYTKALENNKAGKYNISVYHLNRGIAYRYAGDFEKALADYDSSIAISPNYKLPKEDKAFLYLYLGNWAECSAIIDGNKPFKLKDLSEKELELQLLYKKGDYDGCIGGCNKIIDSSLKVLENIYLLRGRARLKAGDYVEAIDDFNNALVCYEAYPNKYDIHHDEIPQLANLYMAEAQLLSGDFKAAMDCASKAIALDKDCIKGYDVRRMANYLYDNMGKAREDDKKIKEVGHYQSLFPVALANEIPKYPYQCIEWLSPIDDVNELYKGSVYVDSLTNLEVKARVLSQSPIDVKQISVEVDGKDVGFEHFDKIDGQLSKGKKGFFPYQFTLTASIPLNVPTSSIRIRYSNVASQVLMVSKRKMP